MLESGNKERFCSPVGFSEEFPKLKISQIGTENDKKNPKLSNFQSVLTDFVDWNVKNGHRSKNLLFSSVLWR